MQRYFNCRVRGCVRERGYHECGYILLLLLLLYTTERDVSGAAARVTITAAGRSGFRGFFSNPTRERGNYIIRGPVVFAVIFNIIILTPCFGFLSRLRALCKTRLRKTRGVTHSDCFRRSVKFTRRTYCIYRPRAVCTGRYIKFIVRYMFMDVGFGDLRAKSSRPNIIIHIGRYLYIPPYLPVKFENVLEHGRAADGIS